MSRQKGSTVSCRQGAIDPNARRSMRADCHPFALRFGGKCIARKYELLRKARVCRCTLLSAISVSQCSPLPSTFPNLLEEETQVRMSRSYSGSYGRERASDRANGSSIIAVGQRRRFIFVKRPLSMKVLSQTPVYLPWEHVAANPRDKVNSHVFAAN